VRDDLTRFAHLVHELGADRHRRLGDLRKDLGGSGCAEHIEQPERGLIFAVRAGFLEEAEFCGGQWHRTLRIRVGDGARRGCRSQERVNSGAGVLRARSARERVVM